MQAGEPEDPPLPNSEDPREKGDRRPVELDWSPILFVFGSVLALVWTGYDTDISIW